jgi:hypothetical protein
MSMSSSSVTSLRLSAAAWALTIHYKRSNTGAVRPNPSLKLTRYGMQRKPGVRRLGHLRTPGLHCTPTRAA